MTDPARRIQKRVDALSREQIVTATIELLDSSGEGALTVRALTERLATGRGAIYHYVTGKEDLLAAATETIIGAAFESAAKDPDPRQSLRNLALGIFDALTEHPWVGAHLGREPRQPAVLRIWHGLGSHLRLMGVTGDAATDAGAALMNYLLGAAAQYAATSRHAQAKDERAAFLDALATELSRTASDEISQDIASALAQHDDREQFLAGTDIFLAGIDASRRSAP